jgi:hypothetical protein
MNRHLVSVIWSGSLNLLKDGYFKKQRRKTSFFGLICKNDSVVYSLFYGFKDCPDKLVNRSSPNGYFLTL